MEDTMSAPSLSPDLLLARRAAGGRADAWEELLALYSERVYNLAFHFAGCGQDADDLTQEIFLRLYQNLRLYRGDVPLAAWALRLSRNVCIDHYRRSRRERRATALSDELLARLPADDDPQAEAQKRQQLRAVYHGLEEMSEDLAEVVLLRDLQGWSLEETAACLEVPVGTVKSRLHRARLELAGRVTARLGVRVGAALCGRPGREREGEAPLEQGGHTGPPLQDTLEAEPC
jgi:RNA polymerase sigma-70 factor (ECF subfamily)